MDNNNFSNILSVHLIVIDHLSLKLLIHCRYAASFKIWISKVQNFGNFELSPMEIHVNPFSATENIKYIYNVSGSSLMDKETLFKAECHFRNFNFLDVHEWINAMSSLQTEFPQALKS